MKRLALLLAAATVATGCIVVDDDRCVNAVTVDWSRGFLGSDGLRRGCADAGVAWVDLYVNGDGSTAFRVACGSLAAQAVDLPRGTNVLTVEGVEASGRIAYRAAPRVTSDTCGDRQVAVTPAEGELLLAYSFSPTNVCHAAQPTHIWTKVWDEVAGEVAFQDTERSGLNLCSTELTYRLPAGSYTLLGVNEYSPTAGIVGADCTDRGFEVLGGASTTVPAVLLDSAQACF